MKHAEGQLETQSDYIAEMMNVAAGHSADVLSQMLGSRIEMKIPVVRILPGLEAAVAFVRNTQLFVCSRMELFGDVRGAMHFMVADDQKDIFLRLARQRGASGTPGGEPARHGDQPVPEDLSVISEIGNILVGTFLATIQRFCGLRIIHSVPFQTIDMFQALLDEDLARVTGAQAPAIVIENLFLVTNTASSQVDQSKAHLLMIPYPESTGRLESSISEARRRASGA
jgi:chemotaxis protein CheC